MITDDDRKRANELAKKLGVVIYGNSSAHTWHLPLLEALYSRIEELEAKVKQLEGKISDSNRSK